MKRKSSKSKKSTSYQEEENDLDENQSFPSDEENGKANSDDSYMEEEPKEKKRKSKGKNDSIPTDPLESDSEELPQKKGSAKKKAGRGRKAKDSDKSTGEEELESLNGEEDDDEPDNRKKNSPKKKPGRGRKAKDSDKSVDDEEQEGLNGEDDDDEPEKQKKYSPKKKPGRGRKAKEDHEKQTDNEADESLEEDEEQYEVEKIISDKMIRGERHYLIRWKGYGPNSDTWEPEATLSCPDKLEDYKKVKKSSPAKSPKKNQKKTKKTPEPEETWDENEDFEVVRILDVHFMKDGKREFLVAWKGYPHTYDSWEPEENMDCKDLIQKFMKKCEKAREMTQKDLRVNRKITDRFTLSTNDTGRRLSRRAQGKQRVHYHDTE